MNNFTQIDIYLYLVNIMENRYIYSKGRIMAIKINLSESTAKKDIIIAYEAITQFCWKSTVELIGLLNYNGK
jgi:hypothetical protein